MSSEEESMKVLDEMFWKRFIKKHWVITIICGAAVLGAIIGGILVLLLYIPASEVGGYGAWTFDEFSMGTAILWGLFLILWEFLLVVLPTVAFFGILIALLWFKILLEDDKEELKKRHKEMEEIEKKRKYWNKLSNRKYESGGGGFSFLLFIGVCIYVFVDGNWLTPFGSLSFSYFIYAYLTTFVWISIIFGIPVVIMVILWIFGKFGEKV